MLTELAKAELACVSVFRTAHPPSKEIMFPTCVDMMVPRKGERKGRGKEGREGRREEVGVREGERRRVEEGEMLRVGGHTLITDIKKLTLN